MSFMDKVAEGFEELSRRRAFDVNHHALCRCVHRRLLHQFDAHHRGTCTQAGCKCARFEER